MNNARTIAFQHAVYVFRLLVSESPHAVIASLRSIACRRIAGALGAAAFMFLSSFAALAAPERFSKGGIEYIIDRPQSWIATSEFSASSNAPAETQYQIRHRLMDWQLSLTGSEPQRYMHHAFTVLTPAAVERAGSIAISFSPDSERLTLHTLAVVRAGVRMDKLHTARLEVLRQEQGRENALYDGVVTADFLLDDVRVGDTIDVEYTLSGSRAVLGQKYAESIALASKDPIDDLRVRAIYLPSHELHYQVVNADVAPRLTGTPDQRELTLRRQQVAALEIEPATPLGDARFPRLRLSEYESWAQVAQWADVVYRVPEDLSEELRQTIAQIRSSSKDNADAIVRALRFVETEVRYVGIEIGESTFKPSHPNVVLARRYGDCKDKAMLLSAILRGLGYKAYPALVSTFLGQSATNPLPSPRVFDHMIVMTEVGTDRYWLDATRTYQRGTLDRIGNPQLHWALVTGQRATALVEIAPAKHYEQKIRVQHRFVVRDYRKPVSLSIVETYHGILAEVVRMRSVAERANALEANTRLLQRTYPGAEPLGELQVSDDEERNALTVSANYTLPQFFDARGERGIATMYAWMVYEFAEAPTKLNRTAPLALVHPMSLQLDLSVELPEEVAIRTHPPLSIVDDNVDFRLSDNYANKRLQVTYTLATRRAAVPAKEVKAYADTLQSIRDRLAYSFAVPGPSSAHISRDASIGLRPPGDGESDAAKVTSALDLAQEAKVRAATEQIDAGRLSGKDLAQVLVDRALAYSLLDQQDRALADLDRAIELDAQADTYHLKGEVYSQHGDQERALEAFAQAVKLEPRHDVSLARGHAYFLQGNYRAAQADLKDAVEHLTGDSQLHAVIWLYFATQRLGQDARTMIAAMRSRADLSKWPGPAVTMLLGQSTEEEMLAAAWSFDRKTELLQRCEAYFFLGEQRLLNADKEGARAAFKEALGTGVKMYLEYAFSRLELARLEEQTSAKR